MFENDTEKCGPERLNYSMSYFQAVLSLPEEISQGEDVHKFFEQWPSDSCTAAINK